MFKKLTTSIMLRAVFAAIVISVLYFFGHVFFDNNSAITAFSAFGGVLFLVVLNILNVSTQK